MSVSRRGDLAPAPGGGVVDSSDVNRTSVKHVRRVGDELVAGGAAGEFGGRTAVLPQCNANNIIP